MSVRWSVHWSVCWSVSTSRKVGNIHFRPCPPVRNWWPFIRPCTYTYLYSYLSWTFRNQIDVIILIVSALTSISDGLNRLFYCDIVGLALAYILRHLQKWMVSGFVLVALVFSKKILFINPSFGPSVCLSFIINGTLLHHSSWLNS